MSFLVCCRSESGAGRHSVALCGPGQWMFRRLPKLVPQPGEEQGPSCSLSGDIQTYIPGKGMNSIIFCCLVYALYMYRKTCNELCTLYMCNTSWSSPCWIYFDLCNVLLLTFFRTFAYKLSIICLSPWSQFDFIVIQSLVKLKFLTCRGIWIDIKISSEYFDIVICLAQYTVDITHVVNFW